MLFPPYPKTGIVVTPPSSIKWFKPGCLIKVKHELFRTDEEYVEIDDALLLLLEITTYSATEQRVYATSDDHYAVFCKFFCFKLQTVVWGFHYYGSKQQYINSSIGGAIESMIKQYELVSPS